MLYELYMQMIIDFTNGEKRYAAFTGGKVPLGYDEFVLWMRAGGEEDWWHSPTFLRLLQVNGRTHFDYDIGRVSHSYARYQQLQNVKRLQQEAESCRDALESSSIEDPPATGKSAEAGSSKPGSSTVIRSPSFVAGSSSPKKARVDPYEHRERQSLILKIQSLKVRANNLLQRLYRYEDYESKRQETHQTRRRARGGQRGTSKQCFGDSSSEG